MADIQTRQLRIGAIAGAALGAIVFAWQAYGSDVTALRFASDPCEAIRPATVAMLVPQGQKLESNYYSDGIDNASVCVITGRDVRLTFGIVHYGRGIDGSPVASAHRSVSSAGHCRTCDPKPTARRIGDESYEYTGSDTAVVWIRVGATSVSVSYGAQGSSERALLEAARVVGEEVAYQCVKAS